MTELSRSADQTISELQKTDPVKAGDCSSHVERLKVYIFGSGSLISHLSLDVSHYKMVFVRPSVYRSCWDRQVQNGSS